MKIFTNVAAFVRTKRLNIPKSQKELSHMLGYGDGQFISNVERGLCGIPNKKVAILCKELKCEVDEYLKWYLMDIKETLLVEAGVEPAPNHVPYSSLDIGGQ